MTDPSPQTYIETILDVFHRHAVNRRSIDWTAFDANLRGAAEHAQTIAETYPAVQESLADLQDGHSAFLTPETFQSWSHGCQPPLPTAERRGTTGYLNIPWFVPGDSISSEDYVDRVHGFIRDLRAENVTSFVIDLRENTGGNVWPMLCGLAPLFGEGKLGAFQPLDGEEIPFGCTNGAVWAYGKTQAAGFLPAPQIEDKPRVALLIGEKTASSGEILSVVGKGLPHMRSFGTSTYGQATFNERFDIDDTTLFLTTGFFSDRHGKTYSAQIEPDEAVVQSGPGDITLQRAMDWVEQPFSHRPVMDAGKTVPYSPILAFIPT